MKMRVVETVHLFATIETNPLCGRLALSCGIFNSSLEIAELNGAECDRPTLFI